MTDPLGIIVQGLPTYTRTRVREDIEQLARCAGNIGAKAAVGLPLHMSGDASPMSRYTTEFTERLSVRTGLEVEYTDERLTSVEAEERLKEAGQSIDRKTGNVDRMAAIILLQDISIGTHSAQTTNHPPGDTCPALARPESGTPSRGRIRATKVKHSRNSSGTSTAGMAEILRKAGVIQANWQFMVARALQQKAKLQAGEYKFDHPMSPADVFGKIARGDVYYHELRIPEGANLFDISDAVAELGFITRQDS